MAAANAEALAEAEAWCPGALADASNDFFATSSKEGRKERTAKRDAPSKLLVLRSQWFMDKEAERTTAQKLAVQFEDAKLDALATRGAVFSEDERAAPRAERHEGFKVNRAAAEIATYRCDTLFAQGRFAEARELAETALRENTRSHLLPPQALFGMEDRLARCLWHLGLVSEAHAACFKLLQRRADDVDVWLLLCKIFAKLNRPREALYSAAHVMRVTNRHPSAWVEAGMALLRVSREAAAEPEVAELAKACLLAANRLLRVRTRHFLSSAAAYPRLAELHATLDGMAGVAAQLEPAQLVQRLRARARGDAAAADEAAAGSDAAAPLHLLEFREKGGAAAAEAFARRASQLTWRDLASAWCPTLVTLFTETFGDAPEVEDAIEEEFDARAL